MTELSVVPTQRLFEVLDVITPIEWPADGAAVMSTLVEQLGWTITEDPYGMDDFEVYTNLPVNHQVANFLIYDEQLMQISFWVTDVLFEGDHTDLIQTTFRQVVKNLSERFGEASGKTNRKWWDLPTGGRLRIVAGTRWVILYLLSREFADIDRNAI
jgi:hypothetical protein